MRTAALLLKSTLLLAAAAQAAPSASTRYDADSGVLTLTQLTVAEASGSSCYDATLRLSNATPLQLELSGLTLRNCDSGRVEPSHYDTSTGLLRLPGLPVVGRSGSSCVDAVLQLINASPLRLQLVAAAAAPCASGGLPVANGTAFRGNVVLGSPSRNGIKANVYAADQSGTVSIAYGIAPGIYNRQTPAVPLAAAQPREIAIGGLFDNLRYHYRLVYQSPSGAISWGEEASFQTARPPGSSFTFTVQGDSHPERRQQFDAELYLRTLGLAAADKPDFHIMLGDDFSVDTLNPATITQAQVVERYTLQRPWLGTLGRSAPIFLVNGNHEQAARYLLDGTPNNVAVWAQNARNAHYAQPAPDDFYSGNSEVVPHIGLLRNHYAWTWGDALFVVIDPYWSSPVVVDSVLGGAEHGTTNLWDVTHGDAQYRWLERTLKQSTAKYKFVFAHHVLGTGRGGVEVATRWEWGGQDTRGLYAFPTQRPTWAQPIHQLMAANKVNIFFQGHDHIWVHQQLDGVTYQTVSEPADPNYALYFDSAYLSGERFPNSGYTRVRVSPDGVQVDYVRSWLPRDEGPGKLSGSVAFSYRLR